MRLSWLLISLPFLIVAGHAAPAQQQHCPTLNEVPMSVAGNAAIVTLDFKRPDGTIRPARFAFDSGGGAIIVDQRLAENLGLKPTGEAAQEGGASFVPTSLPAAYIGSQLVSLSTSKAFIHRGKNSFDTRERIEGLLPGKALEPYQVVLDYPRRTFTVAPAGCVPHQGQKVPGPFVPSSGHPRIEISVDGKTYGLLLDTGSRVALARRDLLEGLSVAHPTWPHATGASGTADMPGSNEEEFLLRVPEVMWGTFQITNVLFVSRPNELYSPTSFETPGPIAGALGGNVLRNFRVEIDYPHGAIYLEQMAGASEDDMNCAGLVLDVDKSNHLVVRAISNTAATLTKRNIRPGDIILAIGDKREAVWKIIDASGALSGRVGETKRVVILRSGRESHTDVTVAHIL
jgi:hypothetical protein